MENQLNEIIYKSNNNIELCVICQQNFCNDDILKILDCIHKFHKECIYAWLKESSLCPLCKHEQNITITTLRHSLSPINYRLVNPQNAFIGMNTVDPQNAFIGINTVNPQSAFIGRYTANIPIYGQIYTINYNFCRIEHGLISRCFRN
jgi:hypothetical protein